MSRQDLWQVICQVLRGKNSVGTAFVVDKKQGLLVTCYHVVELIHSSSQIGEFVNIRFPNSADSSIQNEVWTTKVLKVNREHDVALLEVVEIESRPLPHFVGEAVLGNFSDSLESQNFQARMYGYRKLGDYQGAPGQATLVDYMGDYNPHGNSIYHVMVKTQDNDHGMSGGPVLDFNRNLVVGMILRKWNSKDIQVNRDTSIILDVAFLKKWGLITYEDYPFPSSDSEEHYGITKTSRETVETILAFDEKSIPWMLEDFPTLTDSEIIGRQSYLDSLYGDYINEQFNIATLVGLGGGGKSFVAQTFIQELKDKRSDIFAVFWWNLYASTSFSDYIRASLSHIRMHIPSLSIPDNAEEQLHLFGEILINYECTVVLDGFETLQNKDGTIKSDIAENLLQFLKFFPAKKSFCLVTSRFTIQEIARFEYCRHYIIERLSDEQGIKFLQSMGLSIVSEIRLKNLVQALGGHLLALKLVASRVLNEDGSIHDTSVFYRLTDQDEKNPYKQLNRILQTYQEQLSDFHNIMLYIFSLFRQPRHLNIIHDLIYNAQRMHDESLTDTYLMLPVDTDIDFEKMAQELVDYGLFWKNTASITNEISYTMHPLIRHYYYEYVKDTYPEYLARFHRVIADDYIAVLETLDPNDQQMPIIWSEINYHLQLAHDLAYHVAFPDGSENLTENEELEREEKQNLILGSEPIPVGLQEMLPNRFLLLSLLGKGGQAKVYLAFDKTRRHSVAIKIFQISNHPDNIEGIDTQTRRIRQSIEFIQKYRDMDIVDIYDYDIFLKIQGEEQSIPPYYMVMKYYSGGTLEEYIKDKANYLDLETVINILLNLSEVLSKMHLENYIHRDVKTRNVLIELNENEIDIKQVVLADFGLLRTPKSDVTKHQFYMGTPGYSAPEIFNMEFSAHSDLYALAVVTYRMLSGQYPFSQDGIVVIPKQYISLVDQIEARQEGTPQALIDLAKLSATFDAGKLYEIVEKVDSVIEKALVFDPEKRFSSVELFVQSFISALDNIEIDSDTSSELDTKPFPNEEVDEPLIINPADIDIADTLKPEHVEELEPAVKPSKPFPILPTVAITLILIAIIIAIVIFFPFGQANVNATATQNVISTGEAQTEVVFFAENQTQTALAVIALETETPTPPPEIVILPTDTVTANPATEIPPATTTVPFTPTMTPTTPPTIDTVATSAVLTEISIQVFETVTAQFLMDLAQATNTPTPIVASPTLELVTPTIDPSTPTLTAIPTVTPISIGNIGIVTRSGSDVGSIEFSVLSAINPECSLTTDSCQNDILYIMNSTVRISEYRVCYAISLGPCDRPNNASNHFNLQTNDLNPVIDVIWGMANIFCNTYGGRLPTESEWTTIILPNNTESTRKDEWIMVQDNLTNVYYMSATLLNRQRADINDYSESLSFRCVFEL